MYHYIEAKIIITVIPSLIKLNFEILIYFEKEGQVEVSNKQKI